MVKSITDIENIWQRLKFAYGDVKHMLSKKINQLSGIESLSRSKSPDSLVLTLSKIANLMKELVKLAEEHHIENYLYYGDALQRISTLLGDSLLSRWLAKSQHDTPPKESWNNLLQFIEKEQQLQQQKIILLGSTHNSTPKSPRTLDQPKTNKDHKHHGFNTFSSPICSICQSADGVSDHVSTSGPSGRRIIQYYPVRSLLMSLLPIDSLYSRKRGTVISVSTQEPKHHPASTKKDAVNTTLFANMTHMEDTPSANMFSFVMNIRTTKQTKIFLTNISNDVSEVPIFHYLLETSSSPLLIDATNQVSTLVKTTLCITVCSCSRRSLSTTNNTPSSLTMAVVTSLSNTLQ